MIGFRRGTGEGEQTDAHAGADTDDQRLAVDLEVDGPADRVHQTIGQCFRALAAIAFTTDQHEKFIASQAADDIVATQGVSESFADDAQDLVADMVTMAVIDGLEAIQVDEQRSLYDAGCLDVEHLIEMLHQGASIEQSGERVACRVVAQIVSLVGDVTFAQEQQAALSLSRVGAHAGQQVGGHHEEGFVGFHQHAGTTVQDRAAGGAAHPDQQAAGQCIDELQPQQGVGPEHQQ